MATVLADARRGHRGLYFFAVAMAGLAVVLAALLVVDDRVLLGAPLWLKPLKFAVSLVAYAGTLAWILGRFARPTLQKAGWTIAAAGTIEMVIIVGQASAGNRSHFNDDNALGVVLFDLMGATITVLWLATLAVALRILREPARDAALASAIRLGLAVALLGAGVGFVMAALGSHAVGVPDGGPGLPLVGWSTTGGDLRVAHFVGLHALQALPLLAAALAAVRALDEAVRTRIVRIAGAALAGLVLLLTWQALRAQPLLAPDAVTLGALGALVLATGAAAAGALTGRRRSAVPAVA